MTGPANALPASRPFRIWIDCSRHEYWHRLEIEKLVEAMSKSRSPDTVLAANSDSADCILRIQNGPQLSQDDARACLKWPPVTSPREFVWDYGDLPAGILPGFYASLPSYMFDARRHRAFGIPLLCNELVQRYDAGDARYLYGFFGAVTSGLRARMLSRLQARNQAREGLLVVRDSIWTKMFDRSGLQAKADYAEALRQSRFFLCPKGAVFAGAGSRLYETMQAGRVPVIISDWITLPAGIDWESCSLRIKEREISKIPEILRGHLDKWESMAARARQVWETHFCEEAMLGELGRHLRTMSAFDREDHLATRLGGQGRICLGLLKWKLHRSYASLQRLRRK